MLNKTLFDRREEAIHKSRIKDIENFSKKDKEDSISDFKYFLDHRKEDFKERISWLLCGNFGQWESEQAKKNIGNPKEIFNLISILEFSSLPKDSSKFYNKEVEDMILEQVNEEIPPATKQWTLENCAIIDNMIKLPDARLDREVYEEVKNALELIGGKWNTRSQGFVFKKDPTELLKKVVSGEKVNLKKEFQFFATPENVANRLVELANIKDGNKVLEPSAGQGAIIKAINKVHPKMVVDCYEFMDINREFLKEIPTVNLLGEDFLKRQDNPEYDRIIANPPFAKNADITHFIKMWESLRVNGTLVCMTSMHWQHSSNKKEKAFQTFLDKIGAEVHTVDAGAFKESGTTIATLIIVAHKFPEDS